MQSEKKPELSGWLKEQIKKRFGHKTGILPFNPKWPKPPLNESK